MLGRAKTRTNRLMDTSATAFTGLWPLLRLVFSPSYTSTHACTACAQVLVKRPHDSQPHARAPAVITDQMPACLIGEDLASVEALTRLVFLEA